MREMIAPQSSLDANPKAKLLPLERIVVNYGCQMLDIPG